MHTIKSNLSQLEISDFEPLLNPTAEASTLAEDEAGSEYLFVLPVIVIVGLCGNIISMVTILNTRLRKVSNFNEIF